MINIFFSKRIDKERRNKFKRLESFGKYLLKLRKKQNVSVKIAAKKIGISNTYLYQVESGKKALCDPLTFRKIAKVYEASIFDILEKAGYWKRKKSTVYRHEKIKPMVIPESIITILEGK